MATRSKLLLLLSIIEGRLIKRKCRRLKRNSGLLDHLLGNSPEQQFKKTFRVSRRTFEYILENVGCVLEKETLTEFPISPRERLAIGLYRLARGDYFYTIGELTGYGTSTVGVMSHEFNCAIVDCLWEKQVTSLQLKDMTSLKNKMSEMEEAWQFPFAWAAIDGCHIPIKCPAGGTEARKDYFKNFYSVVLMAMVDAKYRFVWASCGYPGNTNDSVIFQSTDMYAKLNEGEMYPNITKEIDGKAIGPIILGDSAFPFKPWLLKPYGNAILTDEQSNFNYRLSRARMVNECAFGHLKGRSRALMRKNESSPARVKYAALAGVVLHNICISEGDTVFRKFDLTLDPTTNERRPREQIRSLLDMTEQRGGPESRNVQAVEVRNVLCARLYSEKTRAEARADLGN